MVVESSVFERTADFMTLNDDDDHRGMSQAAAAAQSSVKQTNGDASTSNQSKCDNSCANNDGAQILDLYSSGFSFDDNLMNINSDQLQLSEEVNSLLPELGGFKTVDNLSASNTAAILPFCEAQLDSIGGHQEQLQSLDCPSKSLIDQRNDLNNFQVKKAPMNLPSVSKKYSNNLHNDSLDYVQQTRKDKSKDYFNPPASPIYSNFRNSHNSVREFIYKVWVMVENSEYSSLISWNETGDSIYLSTDQAHAAAVLPLFFKHKNLSSFTRQLNLYGFIKNPDYITLNCDQKLNFINPYFKRGRPDLLCKINRRIPQSTVASSTTNSNNNNNNNDSSSNREMKSNSKSHLSKSNYNDFNNNNNEQTSNTCCHNNNQFASQQNCSMPLQQNFNNLPSNINDYSCQNDNGRNSSHPSCIPLPLHLNSIEKVINITNEINHNVTYLVAQNQSLLDRLEYTEKTLQSHTAIFNNVIMSLSKYFDETHRLQRHNSSVNSNSKQYNPSLNDQSALKSSETNSNVDNYQSLVDSSALHLSDQLSLQLKDVSPSVQQAFGNPRAVSFENRINDHNNNNNNNIISTSNIENQNQNIYNNISTSDTDMKKISEISKKDLNSLMPGTVVPYFQQNSLVELPSNIVAHQSNLKLQPLSLPIYINSLPLQSTTTTTTASDDDSSLNSKSPESNAICDFNASSFDEPSTKASKFLEEA